MTESVHNAMHLDFVQLMPEGLKSIPEHACTIGSTAGDVWG